MSTTDGGHHHRRRGSSGGGSHGEGLVGRAKVLVRSLSGGSEDGAGASAAGEQQERGSGSASGSVSSVSGGYDAHQHHHHHHHHHPPAAFVSVSAGSSRDREQPRGREQELENSFAGPIKVTITTPQSGSKGRSTHSAAVAELLRASSSEESSSGSRMSSGSGSGSGSGYGEGAIEEGEEEEGDSEGSDDDDEDDEEEEPAFDPRKAHEAFIMRALQGLPSGELDPQLSQSLRKKQLKWADEDGGELNNVQYFDKGGEPSQVLRMMLAADARAEGAIAGGGARAAMGREEIVKSLEPYLAQIKGHIQEVLPIKLMRNGTETRTVLITGSGPIRQRVGVAIVWMGGLVKHLKIMRNPEPEFLEDQPTSHGFPGQEGGSNDDASSPNSSSSTGHAGGDSGDDSSSPPLRTPNSTESELLCLDPPYLVPRPSVFPAPTLLVEVVSACNLKSSAKLPRPVNPYVKLKLGHTELRTNVLTNTKNPVWGGQDATHSRFRFQAQDPNAMLRVTVGDWKIGKNLWIARLALPLASIEITTDPKSPGVTKTYALRQRVSRFGKHIEREGASDARLVLRFKYEYPERAWTMQELKARDDARLAEEMEAVAMAAAEEAYQEARRHRESDPAAMAAAVAAAACAIM